MDPISITLICISAGLVLTSMSFVVISCCFVADVPEPVGVVEWITPVRPPSFSRYF